MDTSYKQAASFGPGTAFSLLCNPHRRTTTLPVAKNAAALPRTKTYHLWTDTSDKKAASFGPGPRSRPFDALGKKTVFVMVLWERRDAAPTKTFLNPAVKVFGPTTAFFRFRRGLCRTSASWARGAFFQAERRNPSALPSTWSHSFVSVMVSGYTKFVFYIIVFSKTLYDISVL
jgi:hypothetical protein